MAIFKLILCILALSTSAAYAISFDHMPTFSKNPIYMKNLVRLKNCAKLTNAEMAKLGRGGDEAGIFGDCMQGKLQMGSMEDHETVHSAEIEDGEAVTESGT